MVFMRTEQPQCLPVLKRIVVGGEDLDDSKATFEQQQGGRPINWSLPTTLPE